MSVAKDYVCGVDVGTSAVRAMVCDPEGRVAASASCPLDPVTGSEGSREQSPGNWWVATCRALRQVTAQVASAAVRAVAVDATSGTVCLVDDTIEPVSPGLMYNDGRARGYGERINQVAGDFIRRHGYRFKDNFALARLLWLRDNDPAFSKASRALHQSDFVNAKLIGCVPSTDWSNALKTGCDLLRGGWGAFIAAELSFPMEKLPEEVVAPGAWIGDVSRDASAETGLAAGTAVIAGASDGTAALFASGASAPGDFNTALGSTITIKGVAADIVHDPEGMVYCHRHPAGHWLPGGASNVGCAGVDAEFAPEPDARSDVLARLDGSAERHLPSATLVYPLGDTMEERFPFRKAGIHGFVHGGISSRESLYAAYLQGVAFVERWCHETLESLGARAESVYSTGGGSKSAVWCRLRADVLRKPIRLPAQTETAFGAAVLAAAHLRGGLEGASKQMVRFRSEVDPTGRDFEEPYAAFRAECERRWGV